MSSTDDCGEIHHQRAGFLSVSYLFPDLDSQVAPAAFWFMICASCGRRLEDDGGVFRDGMWPKQYLSAPYLPWGFYY